MTIVSNPTGCRKRILYETHRTTAFAEDRDLTARTAQHCRDLYTRYTKRREDREVLDFPRTRVGQRERDARARPEDPSEPGAQHMVV
jgi:hypothetical protein